jgi:hypothetical protein
MAAAIAALETAPAQTTEAAVEAAAPEPEPPGATTTTAASVLGPMRPRTGRLKDAGVQLLVAEDGEGHLTQWATSRLQPDVAYRLTVDASGRASCACPTYGALGRCPHSVVANGEG